jgi:kinesin family member 11
VPPRAVNVQVAVRCRPLNARERSTGERAVLECLEDTREVICVGSGAGIKGTASNFVGKKTYTYDHVFGPDSSQQDLYEGVVEPIVDEVLQGYNCTVFAYGQTGTGKTHTMEGRRDDDVLCMAERRLPENAGIIPRSVKQVFDHLRSITDEHSVKVSHLELYNEQLTDLLGPDADTAPAGDNGLRVYDDHTKGTFVQGLDEVLVRSEEEIFAVLDKSATKRRTAETLMNKYSSRSHSVFTITIHIKESTPDGADLLKVGKLNLVDLAGSENVGRSGAVRGRAREAGNINQSLLTLGRVITALVEKHPHVPYRDSKLTRLLQESLGGRNKTCVIATVTPGSSSTEETYSTLDYAHRAKSIKNRPTVNQMIAKHVLLKEYTEEISKIKRELEASRAKNGIYLPPEEYERLQATGKQQKEWNTVLESRIGESEKQTHVLKDKLSRTQEALARTFSDLERTRETLAETEETLTLRTNELAVTSQQRDESHHLVGEHVTAEGQLYGEGRALTTALEQAVTDVDSLHARIDARVVAEKSNLAELDELRATVMSQLDYAKTDIETFSDRLFGKLNSCRERTDGLAIILAAHADKTCGELDALVVRMRELRQAHLNQAQVVDADAEENAKSRLKEMRTSHDAMKKLCLEIETVLDVSSRSMGTSLEAIKSGLVDINATAGASFEVQALQVAQFAKEQTKLVERASSELEKQLAGQVAAIMKADATVADTVASQKTAVREAKDQALADLATILNSLVDTTDASCYALSRATGACSSNMQTSIVNMRDSVNEFADMHQKLNEAAVEKSRADCFTAQGRVQSAITAVADEASSAVDAKERSTLSCKNNLRSTVKACGVLSANVDSHEACLQTEREWRAAHWTEVVQQGESEVAVQSSILASGIRETAACNVNVTNAVGSDISDAVGDASAFGEQLADNLSSGVKSRVDAFELAVDVDAALAPPRREWNYPKTLKVVAEHRDLIVGYRQERGLDDVPMLGNLPARVQPQEQSPQGSEGSAAEHETLGYPDVPADSELVHDGEGRRDPIQPTAGSQESGQQSSATAEDEQDSSDDECDAEADEPAQPDGDVLKDRTNLAASRLSRNGVTKPGSAGVSVAAAKRSGLRPMTRRATRPTRSRQE